MLHEIFILLAMLSSSPVAARAARDLPAQKVWTNSDVIALRATPSISIIGKVPSAEVKEVASSNQPYVKERDPLWYARQIEGLRETMGEADAEIKSIKDIEATGEGITNAIPLDERSGGVTLHATLEILASEKSALNAEIDNLQDEARANYIPRDVWR